jgi:hypothetical protein
MWQVKTTQLDLPIQAEIRPEDQEESTGFKFFRRYADQMRARLGRLDWRKTDAENRRNLNAKLSEIPPQH